jgi:hypothetical protein
MLSAEKRQETYWVSNDEKVKWIDDYVERETAVARKLGQDAETAIMQELRDMTTTDNAGATIREPKTTFEELINAIGDNQNVF